MLKNRKMLLNLDFSLLLTIFALFIFGLLIISSATNVLEDGMSREVIIQSVSFCIGILLMFLMLSVDYNYLGNFYKLIYILSIVFLLLVYIPGLGVVQFNARSWINLGVIDLQTSEVAKLGFILSFAKYVELNKYNQLNRFRDLVGPVLFTIPFLLLLLKQPDLGSALVFAFIAFGILYVAGLKHKILGIGVVILSIATPLMYRFMKPHQRIRIDAFLNPNDPSLPGNYHVMQSKITIGSGKLTGRGLFQGVYHKYDYLPVKESDFIFAVAGEETGFVGGAIIIILYYNLLRRMNAISRDAKDIYGSLVATGITFMFAFQIMENIGMTIGIMPVTGVTLPFFSYGGSSLLMSMVAIGIILNIYMRRKRINFNL